MRRLFALSFLFIATAVFAQPSPDGVTVTTQPNGTRIAEHEGRKFALRFDADMARFAAADAKDPATGGIVFTGSSTFVKWTTLQKDMAPLPVVNRAFGGSTSPQLWYYADRAVIPRAPKVVVVYIGDNNLVQEPVTVDNYLKYVRLFVDRVRAKLPATRFLFVSNKPSVARWKYWPKYLAANKALKDFCGHNPGLEYIDTTPALLDGNGVVRQDCYGKDKLHFRPEVYAAWTKIIKPALEQVWREEVGGGWVR